VKVSSLYPSPILTINAGYWWKKRLKIEGNTMKILKYIFMFFVSAIVLAVVGIFFILDDGSDPKEDSKRERIAIQVKSEIEHYYDQNMHYPPSLNILPIASSKEFMSYYKEGVFRYDRSLAKDKPMYQLIWVFSGSFTKEGSPYSFAWSGKQCGNDKAFLNLMSQDAVPDRYGFFDIDLH